MQKLIRKGNVVIAILGGGQSIKRKNVSNKEFEKIKAAKTKEELFKLMIDDYRDSVEKREKALCSLEKFKNSRLLQVVGSSVYWKAISPLSLPIDFAEAVVKADEEDDTNLIETYQHFWTLLSLNPDEECRKNLWWFLQRTGIKLAKCGYFVAYRNVVKTDEKDVNGKTIYTDEHSHTFKIKIGEPVSMPREETDRDSSVTCSKGLHLGASWWLKQNYFGDTGIVCLCNPASVVAVPRRDEYGKLRTCEYIPIDFVKYDKNGDLIQYDVESGFGCEYVSQVIYEGLLGTEQNAYKIEIPEIPGMDKDAISEQLLEIARNAIKNKVIK